MTSNPKACLILIGNEILSGRTKDKNLSMIADKLNQIGIDMAHVRVIADEEAQIIHHVNECRAHYDYVFTTGGIGPTHDDITSASFAKAFGVALLRHPQAAKDLLAYYGQERANAARMKMADVPDGATLIPNPISVAPGFVLGNVYVLAGVPDICEAMMDHIVSRLKGGAPVKTQTLDVDLPEGDIAEIVTLTQQQFQAVEIGVYPRFSKQKLSSHLVLRCRDESLLNDCTDLLEHKLHQDAGAIIIRNHCA